MVESIESDIGENLLTDEGLDAVVGQKDIALVHLKRRTQCPMFIEDFFLTYFGLSLQLIDLFIQTVADFGDVFSLIQKAEVYQDDAGNWQLATEELPAEVARFNRLDSRGDFALNSSVVIAAGFSLRSGKLNIPINTYVSPSKNDFRFGLSFGFNTRK